KQKQLNKAFENASGLKSYLETSIRLGVELDSVSSGVVSQSKFLKDYNKIIKDSSEKFDNFNAAQQDFLNNNDDIIKAYVKQALYQQLIQKAAGLSTKLIENQKKEASEFVNIWDIIWANIKSQNKHVLRGSFMQEVFSGIGKTSVKNKKEEIKGLKDAIKTAMKDTKAAYKEFLELLKKNNLDKYFFGGDTNGGGGNPITNNIKTISDIIADMQKEMQQLSARAKVFGKSISQVKIEKIGILKEYMKTLANSLLPKSIDKAKELGEAISKIRASLNF